MKTRIELAALLLILVGLLAAAEEAKHAPHWTYAGEAGPAHWGELEKDFAMCASGKNQSPVNLSHLIEADLPPIGFDYQPGGYEVINNGHTVQVQFKPGSRIRVDDTDFVLKQVHFHAPSENTIEGRSFPMEAHLVHADAQGHLVVVAVMFEEGAANEWLAKIWPRVPMHADGEENLRTPLAATGLLPAHRDYYRYSGSLTTPPCSEDVRWLVLKQPVKASATQLAVLGRMLGHANNRPVQPLGARLVVK